MEHRVSMIVAYNNKRAIGKDGDLMWRIRTDMKRFTEKTTGHPVIMGRKTWESIPENRRPLKEGRTNFVISSNPDFKAEGATICETLEEALEKAESAPGADEIFIIGGERVYAEGLKYAHRIYETLVFDDAEGDTHFPATDKGSFPRVIENDVRTNDPSGKTFAFITREKEAA